ncbi:hypothetical protein ACJDU8_17710 [Clostridium sp. WILCCON 0269]|uniref:Rho termination factor N-terminal domain-containing protein n=1 Tax=Candidatus Clostridium eludens TaxID=3381663 RepID=A0ABW8SNS1_9CLOT
MAQIEIIKNPYNTICDTYGCSNIGAKVIGKPGENMGQRVIVCDECLQNIVNEAPLEMILNRPGLKEYFEEKLLKEKTKQGLDNIGKLLENEEINLEDQKHPPAKDYTEMKFNDLKEIAIGKGLEFKFGMSKQELIDYLESKEEM